MLGSVATTAIPTWGLAKKGRKTKITKNDSHFFQLRNLWVSSFSFYANQAEGLAILVHSSDVTFFERQRLTVVEDGGGPVTGNEAIDGNVNNLFQDISRIERTENDVALRKAFVGISSDNSDTNLGTSKKRTKDKNNKK